MTLPIQEERLRSARPLRLALVTSSYNYIKDGIALTLNRLVDYLEHQGVEVLVFTPVVEDRSFPHVGTVVPIPSIPLPMRPEYRLAWGLSPAARREMDAFKPDLVHITVPDLLGYQALRYGRRKGLTVVGSYHTRYDTYFRYYWSLRWLKWLPGPYLRYFYSSCAEVYAPSDSMIEVLRTEGVTSPIRLWTRGVDAVRFDPTKRSNQWRTSFGIGADETIVLFVGRLVREKRLGSLQSILDQLGSSNEAHRAVIVGDGPERSALQRMLPDAIFTGFLDGEDLATAFASSDIFLFPSDTETFGNVTLEAMASGLPTVCADATGSRSLVLPDVTGFLAHSERPPEFVGHLRRLLADRALRERMGLAARERALTFTWDAAMGRLLGYYRALVPDEALRQ